jgi:hypothetical protein
LNTEQTNIEQESALDINNTSTTIVDFFSYFNPTGKEILELRYNLLKDKVDKFVICESNKTQSGIQIEYELEKTLEELNIPKDKIEIIKLDIPEDDCLPVEEIDRINCYEDNRNNIQCVYAKTRERLQKDSILRVLNNFSDDTIFIISDQDEIINPDYLDYIVSVVQNYVDVIIKIPLVDLQGRANLRLHNLTDGSPTDWSGGMFICTKNHLKNATPCQIRGNVSNPYKIMYAMQDNKRIEDLGWHFSWMGDAATRKIKLKSFSHFYDTFSYLDNKSYNSEDLQTFVEHCQIKEGERPPGGYNNSVLKKYPLNLLPEMLFKIPRVKDFLLPQLMNKLENLPNINFITLTESFERKKHLHEQFLLYGISDLVPHIFERFERKNFTIKGKLIDKTLDPLLGAGTSHLKAIKKWLDTTTEPYGFFCEDDISLETVEYWNFTWSEFIKKLPKNWDCIQLGILEEQLTEVNFRERNIYDWSLLAYIVTRDYAKKIINNHYNGSEFNFDVVGYDLPPSPEHIIYLNEGKVYSFPLFVENINFKSTITPKKEYPETYDNHKKSYQHVVSWWKNTGQKLDINDIIKN